MELSLTTFILEIVNFLVLVWILKRLFFAPVKKVIEERKAAVAKTLKDAQETKTQAEALKVQYEGRLKEWEGEKSKAQEELQKSLADEKSKRLKQIELSLVSERDRVRAQEEKRAAESRERLEHEAIQQSLVFTSRLLGSLASPELEEKIIKITLDRLRGALSSGLNTSAKQGGKLVVRTAFALSDAQKNLIRDAVKTENGGEAAIDFITEQSLLAGIEVVRGSTVVRANLRDELAYFSEEKQP